MLRMTRDQGIPDRQSSNKLPPPRGRDSLPRSPLPRPVHPVTRTPIPPPPPPTPRSVEDPSEGVSHRPRQQRPATRRPAPKPPARTQRVAPPPPQPPITTGVAVPTERPRQRRRRFGWLTRWQLWVVAMILVCGGSGALALVMLLQIPGMPNCPAIFWPLASASLRFECARLAANKQTAKDLLEAIALLDSLPADHPMRQEANRLVEQWSQDVLKLAEQDFNLGKLGEAIAAARRIPPNVSAHKVVDERIQRWQSIWKKAEEIYKKAEGELRQQDFRQAFAQAVRLLDVENTYWQTVKYDELTNRITVARNDGNKLGQAMRLADMGSLKRLLEAIKLVESIRPDSYLYEAAQKAIPRFGQKMMDLAQAALDRRDLSEALSIIDKIPEKANLAAVASDFTILARAQSHVWQNTTTALEEGIAQAQQIGSGRPLYKKAQTLITRWQMEIEALAQLDKAKLLAQSGGVNDLTAGIAEASQVKRNNPRWQEAQQQISRWRSQIETVEDRPLLEYADQIAAAGDNDSLSAAIDQAKQIGEGRALYGEARRRIQQWTAQIQRTQDQPILDQARAYANSGDLTAAVSTAQQIRSGRSLYQEAQSDIRKWRDSLQAEKAVTTLQEARNLANTGSPTSLASAIQMADQIPGSSRIRTEANTAINEWSQQLLQVAVTQSNYDLAGAIAIVEKIPPRATTYNQAQQLVRTWRQMLGR